jgi:transposase InsO family protein
MIKELSVQYQIKESCQALGVSRSGYYPWGKEVPSRRKRQESELFGGIERVFGQNQKRYGSPRVTQALRVAGRRVGKNRVARLMRQRGLVARKKRAFRPKTTTAGRGAEPHRIAGLSPERPDQIWGERHNLCGDQRGMVIPGSDPRSL